VNIPQHKAIKAIVAASLTLGSGCAPEPPVSPDTSMNGGSFYIVRHINLSATPLGLGEGTVNLRGRCLYFEDNLLIWPEDYSLSHVDGHTQIVGDGWTIAPGASISIAGGEYGKPSELPSAVIGGLPPCPGPYLWVADVLRVGPAGSN
jgi:hypothetical protein